MQAQSLSLKKAFQRPSTSENDNFLDGFIGKAIDLVEFDQIYRDVFSYIFGDTLVFKNLNSARIQLGINRAVTIDGELLEKSGAITGGSFSGRSTLLTFGSSSDGDELEPLRKRLLELGETLSICGREEVQHTSFLDKANIELRKLEKKWENGIQQLK